MGKILIAVTILGFSFGVHAAGSSAAFDAGNVAWIGGGGGTLTPNSPAGALTFNTGAAVAGGGDLHLTGPLFVSLSVYADQTQGKVNAYVYTDVHSNVYQASNVGLSQKSIGGDLGLQLRILDLSNFHAFVEAGGFLERWSLSYDFSNATNVSGTGVPEMSQDLVLASGTYAKFGLDLLFAKGMGVRFFARASRGASGAIDALNKQKINFVTGEGYAALVKQF